MKTQTALLAASLLLLLTSCAEQKKSIMLNYTTVPGQEIYYINNTDNHFKVFTDDSVLVDRMSNNSIVIKQETAENDIENSVHLIETHYKFDKRIRNLSDVDLKSAENKIKINYDMDKSGEISGLKTNDSVDESTFAYLKNTLEQGVPRLPREMISPGYNWTQNTKAMIDNELLEASTEYNFVSIVREAGYDCAVIKYEGSMIFPYKEIPKDPDGKSGVEEIKLKGVIYFAYKEGIVVHQREIWESNGSYTFSNSKAKIPFKTYRYSEMELSLQERN